MQGISSPKETYSGIIGLGLQKVYESSFSFIQSLKEYELIEHQVVSFYYSKENESFVQFGSISQKIVQNETKLEYLNLKSRTDQWNVELTCMDYNGTHDLAYV